MLALCLSELLKKPALKAGFFVSCVFQERSRLRTCALCGVHMGRCIRGRMRYAARSLMPLHERAFVLCNGPEAVA